MPQLVRLISNTDSSQGYIAKICDSSKLSQLEGMLNAHSVHRFDATDFIVPRLGTIPSWSSKCLSILNACGIASVEGIFNVVLNATDYDPMTQSHMSDDSALERLFVVPEQKAMERYARTVDALREANSQHGWALSEEEINYVSSHYSSVNKDPTDVEMMMFAQVNSEHCRHKIFNAKWCVEGEECSKSLFQMIKNTYKCASKGVLSAYADNGAIVSGVNEAVWLIDSETREYHYKTTPQHTVIKVETHNHPTAISPDPGAATGSGGEIRDEGATGRGGEPKAALVGYTVSDLCMPNYRLPWELEISQAAAHRASALAIMLEGPIGAARYNNEFGRPCLTGYFRTFSQVVADKLYGYHKPIMIAGGLGAIQDCHVHKLPSEPGTAIVVLGGPGMSIGLGGGAASSQVGGSVDAKIDFASVQRANPEMERRCQEVIRCCIAMGVDNPIRAIHDVGAGGLSNALPELIEDSGQGGVVDLSAIPVAEKGMSPLAIWSNESQERYVLTIDQCHISLLEQIAKRERCPVAVVGHLTAEKTLKVFDGDALVVDLPLSFLLDVDLRKSLIYQTSRLDNGSHKESSNEVSQYANADFMEMAQRVLACPCVADKTFLITIGDRTVTGLVAQDQMVGPWQVPVSDVSVVLKGYKSYRGEAMSMGERPAVAILDPVASVRLAVGEAITNITAASISNLGDIKFSANWMASTGSTEENASLYDAVAHLGESLCPELGICIPVGKDSLSMKSQCVAQNAPVEVSSPLTLVISAFSPVNDARMTLTPLLQEAGETVLLAIDLNRDKQGEALGGSVLSQVMECSGGVAPKYETQALKVFFSAIQQLNSDGVLLAYHDRSDGGFFVSLCEMAFASHLGLTINLDAWENPVHALFNEGLGAIIQVKRSDVSRVEALLDVVEIASINRDDQIQCYHQGGLLLSAPRIQLQQRWSQLSYEMRALRDDKQCAEEESCSQMKLYADVPFALSVPRYTGKRPRVAILREQGVNGHREMAAAFDQAGFDVVDVTMTDLMAGREDLLTYQGLAVCGGFSFGDVLGAGVGWAKSILYHASLREQFERFFETPNTFTLGVCNGCQMLSELACIIPGADNWPAFKQNRSKQFEARLAMVRVASSPSVLLQGMEGAMLPIAVAHGEGRVEATDCSSLRIAMRYVDQSGNVAQYYPANPNGSTEGITGLTTKDGRVTIMMPHPERVIRSIGFSWCPTSWKEHSPWMQLFYNARHFVR